MFASSATPALAATGQNTRPAVKRQTAVTKKARAGAKRAAPARPTPARDEPRPAAASVAEEAETAPAVPLPDRHIEALTVMAGASMVLSTDFSIKRVAVTNPLVIEAHVVEPRELLIDGKGPGLVSLIVWGEGRRQEYQVSVTPQPSPLQQEFQSLFPDEDIRVSIRDEAIILSGRVSSNAVASHIAEIAEKTSSKSNVINLLQLPGGNENQQVMLQVRVAEVNHRALVELGAALFTSPTGSHDTIARTTTQQFAAPGFEDIQQRTKGDAESIEGKFSFSDFLNLFVLNTKYDVGALVKALKARGFFQSLAEPTLIAYNGQEASFLAGGEIPVPITQGLAGGITVTYKEFGVRLTFRPTITGNVIRVKVRPEVSSLDFSAGITLEGFRIPALSTRRAETEVELQDGQSFAIGGLLNNVSQEDRAKVPFLGDVPVLGALFKSRADRKERTELIVLITPHLVRPMNAGEVPPLPTLPERFLRPEDAGVGDAQGDAILDVAKKAEPGGTQPELER
jgi:pilus assembly protein CpaC